MTQKTGRLLRVRGVALILGIQGHDLAVRLTFTTDDSLFNNN